MSIPEEETGKVGVVRGRSATAKGTRREAGGTSNSNHGISSR